jgi:hypothetical protein
MKMKSCEFDLLLDIWSQGSQSPFWGTRKLHEGLLSHDIAKTRCFTKSLYLYRAYIPDEQQMRSLNFRGHFTITTPDWKPLTSWASSQEGAMNFISSREKWLIIKKPTLDMNVFFALANYWKETKGKELDGIPHHQWFDEVIVKMPERLTVMENDVVKTCFQLAYPTWLSVA